MKVHHNPSNDPQPSMQTKKWLEKTQFDESYKKNRKSSKSIVTQMLIEDDMDQIGWDIKNVIEEVMKKVVTKEEFEYLVIKEEEIIIKIGEEYTFMNQLIHMTKTEEGHSSEETHS